MGAHVCWCAAVKAGRVTISFSFLLIGQHVSSLFFLSLWKCWPINKRKENKRLTASLREHSHFFVPGLRCAHHFVATEGWSGISKKWALRACSRSHTHCVPKNGPDLLLCLCYCRPNSLCWHMCVRKALAAKAWPISTFSFPLFMIGQAGGTPFLFLFSLFFFLPPQSCCQQSLRDHFQWLCGGKEEKKRREKEGTYYWWVMRSGWNPVAPRLASATSHATHQ